MVKELFFLLNSRYFIAFGQLSMVLEIYIFDVIQLKSYFMMALFLLCCGNSRTRI